MQIQCQGHFETGSKVIFSYISYAIVITNQLSIRLIFCDILLKTMIAKDKSNISSPVGKKNYAYVGQRSRSK